MGTTTTTVLPVPVPVPSSPRSVLDTGAATAEEEGRNDANNYDDDGEEEEEPAGFTTELNDAVETASAEFKSFDAKLKDMIASLKVRHEAMIGYNESRLETAKQLERFAVGTPIANAVSGGSENVDDDAARVKTPAVHTKTPPVLPQLEGVNFPAIEEMDEEMSKASELVLVSEESSSDVGDGAKEAVVEEIKAEDEIEDGNTVETELLSSSKDTQDTEDADAGEEGSHHFSAEGCGAPEDDIVAAEDTKQDVEADETVDKTDRPKAETEEAGKEVSPVDLSYMDVHLAAYKSTNEYAALYERDIIKYAERWQQVVASRINGRIIEFKKLKENLAHYTGKVEGLRGGVERLKSRNKTVSPKKAERLERNELKLSGAREAHHTYGESLLILMDEVTDRAWRDVYPIFVRMLQFDIVHSADEARLYGQLAESADLLESIGTGSELAKEGRLRSLKESHPEEIYTGNKHTLHPVLSTQHKAAVF